MSHKIDLSEVIALSEKIAIAQDEVITDLDAVNKSIEDLNAMESFTGSAANSAKSYFTDFHQTIIVAFQELFIGIHENLKDHIDTFQSSVDASGSAIIESEYLKDHLLDINLPYQNLENIGEGVKGTIEGIEGIVSISPPEHYTMVKNYRDIEETVGELNDNLESFTSKGKKDITKIEDLLHYVEVTIGKASKSKGEERFNGYKSGTVNKHLLDLKSLLNYKDKAKTIVTGYTTSCAIYEAAKNDGLSVTKYTRNGKVYYRINATEKTLKDLGENLDSKGQIADNNETGKQVYSNVGQEVIKKHPPMQAWNDKATIMDKAKNVGKATGKGIIDRFKDAGGLGKGFTKALGPLGAGLSYYSNYHDAQADGVKGKKAHSRAVVDTTIDTAVGAGVQAGSVALFTAAVPIPGVGTAIGVGVGVLANWALNKKWDGKKSGMDVVKGGLRKIKGWFN